MRVMGGRERFVEMYAAHLKHIQGYAARRCSGPADAADVASETFLVAWRRIGDAPRGEDVRPWLYGIARKVLANHRRGSRRRERLGHALLDAWTEASTADPAELFTARDEAMRVREALASLSDRDRELLTLVSWEGLSPGEAAVALGISSTAARSRLSRARQRLRSITGRLGPTDAPEPPRSAREQTGSDTPHPHPLELIVTEAT